MGKNLSFTLFEFLILLAIFTTLVTIFIAIINPKQIFENIRDQQRINHLYSLNKLLEIFNEEFGAKTILNYASSNVVYLSLKDASPNCNSYLSQLPVLPPNWSYRCSANPTEVNGQGWIPLNFASISLIKIDRLPLDPINQPPYYYSFVIGKGYKFTAKPETLAFLIQSARDGGIEPTLYEVGSNLQIPSPHSGLVGYWSFDEGTGTLAYDYSGLGNNANLINGPRWVVGKVGKALSFDGTDDYVDAGTSTSLDLINNFTLMSWIYPTSSNTGLIIYKANSYRYARFGNQKIKWSFKNSNPGWDWVETGNAPLNKWTYIVITYSRPAVIKTYINGNLAHIYNGSGDVQTSTYNLLIGGQSQDYSQFFGGIIDEVRIYKRVLSDNEIKALYEAMK